MLRILAGLMVHALKTENSYVVCMWKSNLRLRLESCQQLLICLARYSALEESILASSSPTLVCLPSLYQHPERTHSRKIWLVCIPGFPALVFHREDSTFESFSLLSEKINISSLLQS
jgi:hypothetical protein